MARRPNDFYPTPTALTLGLLDAVPNLRGLIPLNIYEPCAGGGAITNVLRTFGNNNVYSSDIDPNLHYGQTLDATYQWPEFSGVDWVITNPPFNCANEILTNIKKHHEGPIALLLRLSFLEPTRDRDWLRNSPPDELIVMPRTSFTGDGKCDSSTVAWFIWQYSSEQRIKVYTRAQLRDITNNTIGLTCHTALHTPDTDIHAIIRSRT